MMDDEMKEHVNSTFKSLKDANEENPIANSIIISLINRMGGLLIAQVKRTNDLLDSIDSRLQAIENNTDK